eukprot:364494-Chlamydomonas_euryale.AAC.3
METAPECGVHLAGRPPRAASHKSDWLVCRKRSFSSPPPLARSSRRRCGRCSQAASARPRHIFVAAV